MRSNPNNHRYYYRLTYPALALGGVVLIIAIVGLIIFSRGIYDVAAHTAAAHSTAGRGGIEDDDEDDDRYEGFVSRSSKRWATFKTYRHQTVPTIYSKNYVRVYDALFNVYRKNVIRIECAMFMHTTQLLPSNDPGDRVQRVLDLGCGTGGHLIHMARQHPRMQVWGIDVSSTCIQHCSKAVEKDYLSNVRMVEGDFHTKGHFEKGRFDAITAFYFTIYYARSFKRLFENVYHWLRPGGHLCMHVVDVHRFDPIVDVANPLLGINPQKYVGKRLMRSRVHLNRGFFYESQFRPAPSNRSRLRFMDRVIDTVNQIKIENQHPVNIVPYQQLANAATDAGLRFVKQIPLNVCGYEYQYLAFFEKP